MGNRQKMKEEKNIKKEADLEKKRRYIKKLFLYLFYYELNDLIVCNGNMCCC